MKSEPRIGQLAPYGWFISRHYLDDGTCPEYLHKDGSWHSVTLPDGFYKTKEDAEKMFNSIRGLNVS